jgi:peptidoglycan/LPS O-acetylase OafA/YrhL
MTSPTLRSPGGGVAEHLCGLEGLRFLCALAVLFWHYSHFGYIGPTQVSMPSGSQPFHDWFSLLYDYGALGVQVFWCISGYVFSWKYAQAIGDRRVAATEFFGLRFARLYPLHLATLLFVAVLQAAYLRDHGLHFVYPENSARQFLQQIFLASNWLHADSKNDYSFNGPIWSVSVEVLVYVIFFALCRWRGRSMLVSTSAVILTMVLFLSGTSKHALVVCAHYFFLGALTSQVYERLVRLPHWPRWSLVTGAAGLGMLALMIVLEVKPSRTLPFLTPFAIVIANEGARFLLPGARALLNRLGGLTYSIYLIHFPLQLLIVLGFEHLGWPIPWDRAWFFVAFFLSTLLASSLSYRYFEGPLRRRIRQWLVGGRTALPSDLVKS